MLTKCVNCGFYVRQDNEFCLNCGIYQPTKISKNSFWKIFTVLFFSIFFALTFILTLILGYILASVPFPPFPPFEFFRSLIPYAILASILVSSLLSWAITAKLISSQQQITKNSISSLRIKERIIEKRVAELSKRERKIIAVVEKIKENDSTNLQEVRRKLLSAREIVLSQFARYELQRQKIELVRLQNGVAPYLYRLHHLSDVETENGLANLEISQTDLARMRQSLTSDAVIDFPGQTLPEKENFLAQLAETANSCDQLREALLSRQAVRALRDISPLEENLKMPHAKEIVHAAETFNIHATLTDFSESFDELELEYKRLRAEEEIGQKILES